MSSSLREATDACRRGLSLQVELEVSGGQERAKMLLQNEEIFLLLRVSS